MTTMRATEINGMVWFDGPNVEIAGVEDFSFLKVMRLINEAKKTGEKTVYTVEALELFLHLKPSDIAVLNNLRIDEAEIFEDNYAVIRVSKNLYTTVQVQVQYNCKIVKVLDDEEYVNRLLAEQQLFDECIYGVEPEPEHDEEELVDEEELLNN